MSDLVERLRKRNAFGLNGHTWMELTVPDTECNEAADRIEALEAALRFALEVMENYSKLDGRDPSYATPSSAIGVARAALAEGQAK